jgi:hypothetical protein
MGAGRGVISLDAILYFALLSALFIYKSYLFISFFFAYKTAICNYRAIYDHLEPLIIIQIENKCNALFSGNPKIYLPVHGSLLLGLA